MHALADSIKTDRYQVLTCIKYEVLGKRPVYDSYKTFCERVGKDVMNYPDFAFWYMRFHNGEMDMDYDRSNDPKPLELLQLPVEIVAKFVEKLDLPSRLIFRNVCKPLQVIVDSCKLNFKLLRIAGALNSHLFVGGQRIDYKLDKNNLGTTVTCGDREHKTKRVNTADFAVSDLKALIKAHKMELHRLEMSDINEDAYLFWKASMVLQDISACLNSRFKIKSTSISCYNPDLIVPVLTLLEPGVLQSICVNHISDEIANTEQWRQAKIGIVENWIALMNPAEIGRFRNFEEFSVNINDISREIMVHLSEALLTFPSFKKCVIDRPSNLLFTINDVAAALALPIQNRKEVRVPIPDSDEVLVIEVSGRFIHIRRIPT